MLAVLLIEMKWLKENRSPAGAAQRQKYYRPLKIEDDVDLAGEGVFLKKCQYFQEGNSVFCDAGVCTKSDEKMQEQEKGKPFTAGDECRHKMARLRNQGINQEKGAFYAVNELEIPCITVSEEQNNRIRIKWFDSGEGMPRRRGGNEDLYKRGAKLAGKPNVCNETAFVLEQGQSGVLKYNYRYTFYSGQWYKCYYVYAVNAKVLTRDIFIRNYDFEYNQLADLF